METYLVTGSAGFIGSHLAQALLDKGGKVRGADNFATGKRQNMNGFAAHPNFSFMEGDLADPGFAMRAAEGIDVVLHQAAVPSVPRSLRDPALTHRANADATLYLLLAARDQKVKRFVYASSSSIYGDNPELPKREDFPVRPISPYALQKYVGERYAHIFNKEYGLPTVSLRYFNVFGPRQDPLSPYSAVIPKFISMLLSGRSPKVNGDGSQSRDFTYIDNVVQANLLAAEADEKAFGQTFNIACGRRMSLNELLDLLRQLTGTDIQAEYGPARAGDVPHSLADISKAQKQLGYQPLVAAEAGLQKTVEYLKTHAPSAD